MTEDAEALSIEFLAAGGFLGAFLATVCLVFALIRFFKVRSNPETTQLSLFPEALGLLSALLGPFSAWPIWREVLEYGQAAFLASNEPSRTAELFVKTYRTQDEGLGIMTAVLLLSLLLSGPGMALLLGVRFRRKRSISLGVAASVAIVWVGLFLFDSLAYVAQAEISDIMALLAELPAEEKASTMIWEVSGLLKGLETASQAFSVVLLTGFGLLALAIRRVTIPKSRKTAVLGYCAFATVAGVLLIVEASPYYRESVLEGLVSEPGAQSIRNYRVPELKSQSMLSDPFLVVYFKAGEFGIDGDKLTSLLALQEGLKRRAEVYGVMNPGAEYPKQAIVAAEPEVPVSSWQKYLPYIYRSGHPHLLLAFRVLEKTQERPLFGKVGQYSVSAVAVDLTTRPSKDAQVIEILADETYLDFAKRALKLSKSGKALEIVVPTSSVSESAESP